jgi:hypothetical protein
VGCSCQRSRGALHRAWHARGCGRAGKADRWMPAPKSERSDASQGPVVSISKMRHTERQTEMGSQHSTAYYSCEVQDSGIKRAARRLQMQDRSVALLQHVS